MNSHEGKYSDDGMYKGHPHQIFGHVTYSQHGEDMIFANIFHILNIEKPSYIDIGAFHPTDISNTAYFYAKGSRGVNIDANPSCIDAFNKMRPDDINLNIGIGSERGAMDFFVFDDNAVTNTFDKETAKTFLENYPEFSVKKTISVEIFTLNDVVKMFFRGIYPDLICIDAEGLDCAILGSADFSASKPKVICVEVGTDSEEICALMEKAGFIFHSRTISNYIFIDREIKNLFFPKRDL